MSLFLLTLTFGLLTGGIVGFLLGCYRTLADHGDLIDDGHMLRSIVADAANASRGGAPLVGDVRGEARVTHLRVLDGGVA